MINNLKVCQSRGYSQKLPATFMKNHIDLLTRFKEERDISAPENIGPLNAAQTNLAFLASLGEPWKLFYQALGDLAHTMKTGELFAKGLAMGDYNTSTSQLSGSTSTLTTPYCQCCQHQVQQESQLSQKEYHRSHQNKSQDDESCFRPS